MIVSALFGSRLVNCANSKHTRVNLYEKKMTQTPLMIAFQLLHYATKYCHFKCCVEEDHNSVGIRLFETTLDESAIIGHALQLHQWLLFISVTPPPPLLIWVWARLVFKHVKHHSGFIEIWNLFFSAFHSPLNRKLPQWWWWRGLNPGGPLAADELLTHCMLASHLRPQSRWNGVDLKTLSPAFWLHAKGNGIWYDSHGLIGFIRSHKLEGQEQNSSLSLFWTIPTTLDLYSPRSPQSIFSSLPLTFSFLSSSIPIYSSILSSTLSLNPATLLTFQFHSSTISLPLLSSWSGL